MSGIPHPPAGGGDQELWHGQLLQEPQGQRGQADRGDCQHPDPDGSANQVPPDEQGARRVLQEPGGVHAHICCARILVLSGLFSRVRREYE